MSRPSVAVAMLLLATLAFAPPAAAADHDSSRDGVSKVLLAAMQDEMQRSMELLRLEELDRPHFIAQTVEEEHTQVIQGSFGAIVDPREVVNRSLKVELRVGSRAFDDNHFVPSDARTFASPVSYLPIEDDYDALRYKIWLTSDKAYKQAVERLSKKRAYQQAKNLTQDEPDLSQEEQVAESRQTVAAGGVEMEAWKEHLRRASAVFRDFPRLKTSYVRLTASRRHLYFVDSEGRSVVQPSHRFELRMRAEGQADDGMTQQDELTIVSPDLGELPSIEWLVARATQLARDVTALTEAPPAGVYLGPVLLEGQAAGEFFSQLLASGLWGSRRPWTEADWLERYFGPGDLLAREGFRVISPLFDAYDDPTVAEFGGVALAGHYAFDSQGIPARRVDLIDKGVLKDVLMGRSPTAKRQRSNGHGRGSQREPPSAHIGNLFLDASPGVSSKKLMKRLRDEARAFGLDYGIVIRRIADEIRRDRDELLAPPVMVYEVDVKTGAERLVRDARFDQVTLRALRDIVAASSERQVYNLNKRGNPYLGGRMPTSIVHPAVLLAEMELAETKRKPDRLPYLPHPSFTQP